MSEPDFTSCNMGTIIVLVPNTDAAREWVEENVEPDPINTADVLNVEPRLFFDIACGLLAVGLTMIDADTGRAAVLPN